jgi:hypothetical protein
VGDVADLGFTAAGLRARTDTDWIDQVTVALISAAGRVALEVSPLTSDDPGSMPYTLEQWQLRSSLARNVLQSPATWGQVFAWVVLFHPDALADTADDEMLTAIIYWEWNAVSGVGPAFVARP